MGRARLITGGGAPTAGGSTVSTTVTGTATVADVQGVTVTGLIDPVSDEILLTISITPPDPANGFLGCHLFLEIPDQSANASFTVGSSPIGSTAAITGPWSPIDLGYQMYSAANQPWQISLPAPSGIDPTVNTSCRIYAVAFSSAAENPLVQANQPSPSPNQAFTLESLDSIAASATGTAPLTGPISAAVLPDDNSTGKLLTPVLVTVSSVPSVKSWAYQLVLTMGTADPTVPANQRVVSAPYRAAGNVPSGTDGISVNHSFTIPTPTAEQTAIVWCVSGLLIPSGARAGNAPTALFAPNNIVPAVTPHYPITFGTSSGVTDPTGLMVAKLAASLAVIGLLFGVAAGGITNSLLGPAAVATINVQNLAVTNPLLASLAVAASNLATNSVTAANGAIASLAVVAGNLANSSVTASAIANLAVGSAAIANLAVGTAAIQTGAITNALIANLAVGTAQIQSLAVTDAKINDLSASKITAGTISASVSMTSPSLTVAGSGFTINLDTSNGFKVTGNGLTTTITNATLTYPAGLNVSDGSTWASIVTNNGFFAMSAAGAIYAGLYSHFGLGTSYGVMALTSGAGYSVTLLAQATATSATSGSETLPSNPVGFWQVNINGSAVKIPYYA